MVGLSYTQNALENYRQACFHKQMYTLAFLMTFREHFLYCQVSWYACRMKIC